MMLNVSNMVCQGLSLPESYSARAKVMAGSKAGPPLSGAWEDLHWRVGKIFSFPRGFTGSWQEKEASQLATCS